MADTKISAETAATNLTSANVIGIQSTANRRFPASVFAPERLPTLSNNATDATNDIDFSAAVNVWDSSLAASVSIGAMTKRLDADWAAGSGNGGRYKGAAIANTTYHWWLCWKADGADPDYYADPSADAAAVLGHLQAETGGSAYLFVRRVGSIVRLSAAIKGFTHVGDTFMWKDSVVDVDAVNPGTSAVTRTLTVPVGIVVDALIVIGLYNVNNNTSAYVSALTATDTAPADSITAALAVPGFDIVNAWTVTRWNAAHKQVTTNTSGQVRSRQQASGASDRFGIVTRGYIDSRGRL